jgi:hypothetical protein
MKSIEPFEAHSSSEPKFEIRPGVNLGNSPAMEGIDPYSAPANASWQESPALQETWREIARQSKAAMDVAAAHKLDGRTEARYISTVDKLRTRAYIRAGGSLRNREDVTPRMVYDILWEMRNTYKPSTFHQHRAAVLWSFANDPNWLKTTDSAQLLGVFTAIKSYKHVRSSTERIAVVGKGREPGRSISEADFKLLYLALECSSGIWSEAAQVFMKAAVASGARPVEWIGASWADPEHTKLRLITAKRKTRNAWGDNHVNKRNETTPIYRDVAINPKDAAIIDEQIRRVQEYLQVKEQEYTEALNDSWGDIGSDDLKAEQDGPAEFDAHDVYTKGYYAYIRAAINRGCKRIFKDGRLYSPYDFRSSFAANRKARFGKIQTAMDMGNTINVSGSFYASANKSWAGSKGGAIQLVEKDTNSSTNSAAHNTQNNNQNNTQEQTSPDAPGAGEWMGVDGILGA